MVKGDKWFRTGQFTGSGESKLQGRGEVDENLRSLLDAANAAVEKGHLKPVFVEGLVRALSVAKRNGMTEVLESIETYEQRVRTGELGQLSGIKAAIEIKNMVNQKVMRVIGPSFF